jgi:integrase
VSLLSFLWLQNVRSRSFLPILKRAALPTVRVYDLRHTVATLLLAADVNMKVVSERLGSAHSLPSMQHKATRAIEAIFIDSPITVPQKGESDRKEVA